MSLRDDIAAWTKALPKVADIKVEPTPLQDHRPKTAPGLMMTLTAAQQRIKELEARGAPNTIPVASIAPNPWQPRIQFNEDLLGELADCILEVGLLQPILVRRVQTVGSEPGYELIAGECRWRAHQMNGMNHIRALEIDVSDADMMVQTLAENINRADLTDYEISKALRRVENEFPTRRQMTKSLGISWASLHRYMAFEHLPKFMLSDLDARPTLFSCDAASDTAAALQEHGTAAEPVARELWAQLLSGSLEQSKFATTLNAALRSDHGSHTSREVHSLYAGRVSAGSITKDARTFTVKVRTSVLTASQEARIRILMAELFDENPRD